MLKNREINKETPIRDKAVKLVVPRNCDVGLFTDVKTKLDSLAGSFDILHDSDESVMKNATGPVVIAGNLADSMCAEYLYHQFLCATDRWYPGPDGYEIRTLCDPFGTGFNAIHIGYSDLNGLEKALGIFADSINDDIPHMKEIKPTRLHFPDEYAMHIAKDVLDAEEDTYFYSFRPENKGYMAYLTGNTEVLGDYIKAMEYILGVTKHHLMFYNRYTVWRLLEVTGMIEGQVAEEWPSFFLDWARSEEGRGSIDKHQYQSPHLARNNHGTIPALGIKMFMGYLKTYHPDTPDIDEIETLADNVYAPYFNGSWKPQCDGLCHGWWLSQPVLLHYGLLDPEKKYFVNGGAKRAAECALAVINNMGYLTDAGDTASNRQHPGFSLRIAAAYYKDGRYRFGNDILPFEYANCGEQSAMFRQFDIGLEPVMPDAGTTFVPIDKLIYDTWEYEDEHHAKMVCDTPPSSGIDKTFDKISFRSGWDYDDDFLLIDGLGGGGHSYSDAGAILEYSVYGIPFLISGDRLTYVEPENHNMVTITKDGLREDIPAFPSIEEIGDYDDGIRYVRLLSKDNNGADWTREIYFIPGTGAAVRDTVEAVEPGEFSIEAHFRTPGSVMAKEDGFVSIRNSVSSGNIAFILSGLNDEDTNISFTRQNYSHLFRTPPGKEAPEFDGLDNLKLFLKRHRISRPEVTAYKAKRNLQMAAGDSVVFTHFMSACPEQERPVMVKETEEGIFIEKGDSQKVLAFNKKHTEREVMYSEDEPEFDFFADLAFEDNAELTALAETDGGYAIGNAEGGISVFDNSGNVRWTARADGAVTSLHMDDGTLYAGVGAGGLASYRNGVNIWKRTFRRIPTMFYWWEYETPRVVSIKSKNGLIFTGCGDNHLRCWDSAGEEKWVYYYRASVPLSFEIVDIDGDGKDEIVISGGSLSAYSQIEIIDLEGNLKYMPNESIGAGWTSFTSAVRIFNHGGERFILQGVNRNKNFNLYKFTGGDSGFETVFSHKLAGAVSALLVDGETIYTGTSLGFLSAYDLSGNRKWVTSLNGGIRYLAKTSEGILAVEMDGTMYRLTDTGTIVTLSMDSMAARRIIEQDDRLVMIQGRELYHVNKEPVNEDF